MSVTESFHGAPSTTFVANRSGLPVSAVGEDVDEDHLFNGEALIEGLSRNPKVVSPIYFYDDRGSRLFEELCREPTYYLYRTELDLLTKHAASIAGALDDCAIVELGCGNATKTRILLRALLTAQGFAHYLPIDVNRSFLLSAGHALARELPNLKVEALVGTYDVALGGLGDRLDGPERRCFLSLGSSLGNFEDHEITNLVSRIRQAGNHGDLLLLGLDLHKDTKTLEQAYNNQTAILTNFAVLEHINWRFRADFDIFRYRVRATYNAERHRIEEQVESLIDQTVILSKLGFTLELAAGDRIRTEISRKFVLKDLVALLGQHGFTFQRSWRDDKACYALCLFERGGERLD